MEFTLLAAALTGVAAMWATLRLSGHSAEFDRLLGAAAIGLLFGRVVAVVAAGVNPLTHPLDLLAVRGGVDTVGAALGAMAFLVWSAHADLGVLDAVASASVAGIAGWHAGCLWRGACLGAETELPWGWALAGSSVERHPVELYAAGLMIVGLLLLIRLPGGTGMRAALAPGVVAAGRLLTQPLRPSLSSGVVAWYAVALVTAVVIAVGILLLRRRIAGL